jgi:hypothetical protein
MSDSSPYVFNPDSSLHFSCPEREAEASLEFPLLRIRYEAEHAVPKVQEHEVFRATLYKPWKSDPYERYSFHELREPMPCMQGVGEFLSELDSKNITASKAWDFDRYDLKLNFKMPVTVAGYDGITRIIMTYKPWWTDTPAMKAAHAEWRAWVKSQEDSDAERNLD